MAFTVSTNTYCDVAFADTYLLSEPLWAALTDKESILMSAAKAIDLKYGKRFNSYITNTNQTMLWPRYPFYDTYGRLKKDIPIEVQQAQCEMALMILKGNDPFKDYSDNIEEKTTQVGKTKISKKFTKKSTSNIFNKIDMILSPILISSNIRFSK